ncbi:MAG: bifunctional DNA primase/polymerase [Burkholderiaceae bacterium]
MDLYAIATDYLESGLRLIPLHPILADGKCACGDLECSAAGKHPIRANWQHQSLVDSASVNDIWRVHYRCNGLGWALDADHIVIDVDKRSGGLQSLDKLQKDLSIDLFAECSAIVKTGGGGWHFYFRKNGHENLGWKIKDYPGIDIKQAGGFVVIAGSVHSSGSDYEFLSFDKSFTHALTAIPESLAVLLTRTYSEHRAKAREAGTGDLEEIADMLAALPNNLSYDEWIAVGMAIHTMTDGSPEGFNLWEQWSGKSPKYKSNYGEKKWFSFGKYSGTPVGSGTLVKMATDAGWQPQHDTAFLSPEELAELRKKWDQRKAERGAVPSMSNDDDIDLYAPPGLLGRINEYVYSCCTFPNKNLALACAISVLTNTVGRRFAFPGKYASFQPNMLIMCVAGSSVGKDSILGAGQRLLSETGLGSVIAGRIRSDKDLIDALCNSQYALYYNDEFGSFLQRLENAKTKGGASYLEGIIAMILEASTKGDKTLRVERGRKMEYVEYWGTHIGKIRKSLDDGSINESERPKAEARLARAQFMLSMIQNEGFRSPFLSIFATATPATMESAFSGESTENGFLSRALVFFEPETNPRPKPEFAGTPDIPTSLSLALRNVAFVKDDCPFNRIDSYDTEPEPLAIDDDAMRYIDRARDYFFDLAELQKERGLESLPRRALDSIIKVCIGLGAEGRRVTLEHARYAVKLVRQEIERKITRVVSTEGMASKVESERVEGAGARILEICGTEKGELFSVIAKKVSFARLKAEALQTLLGELVAAGYLTKEATGKLYNGVMTYRYKSTGKGAI